MKNFPCAKINIGLNVVSKRPDGYHNLETVFYPVGIYDELEIEQTEGWGNCNLTLKGVEELCEPQDNLVVKAYALISAKYNLPSVNATLCKNIPSQAGMGGGSSDAAFMIKLLNEQFELGMTSDEMQGYAAKLGADCAFFINAQPAYATGIGEVLTPCSVDGLKGKYLALVKPDVAVSTKEAYAGIKPCKPEYNCLDIVQQPIEKWKDALYNDFEDSIFPKLPVLNDVKTELYKEGALYAAMSGSGSTIFGIFDENPSFISTKFKQYYNKVLKL